MSKPIHQGNETVVVEPTVTKSDVALREEAIQQFWLEHDIFNKSLTQPASSKSKGEYVFYDGPPFATGTPHYGHILASTIKDAIPRFWTMQGYRVRRKWGWDCHGLPLENLIEKKLGLATKRDIEAYGVKNFNEQARDAVLEYADYWKVVIPRMGRWADMEDDYKTMDSTYTESVWWVFSELHKKGLVFEGFKTMHLCPRCGTTLSNFEVNLGYKDIKDISVTVKLPLLDAAGVPTDTSLLVWTTTPWTLPGNLAAAVHQDFDYVKVAVTTDTGTEQVVLAKGRLAQLGDVTYEIVAEFKGAELVGTSYQPPFPWLKNEVVEGKENAWKIYHADYVELGEEGTGAVHLAPAYGEEDMQLAKHHGVPVMHHVDTNGHFMPWVKDFAGQLVKPKDDDDVSHLDADIEVVKKLKEYGALFKKENITHSYPHCWRCDTPLLNYATTSWFVNVPELRDKLVAANNQVHWVPEHVGTNRFGKWLEGARDWAVSRQRYWGAPLPIWKNPQSGTYHVIGSRADLEAKMKQSGNTYLLMRHGEAESNLEGRISANKATVDNLTETGVRQVAEAMAELQTRNIDLIIHSSFNRTTQTAKQVAAALGLSAEQVVADDRLIELQAGADLEGKTWSDYQAQFANELGGFTDVLPDRENRMDVVKRVGELLYEVEAKYQGKTILFVGHASSLFGLRVAALGLNRAEAATLKATDGLMNNAEVRELPFTPLPHNDDYTLDYHRPYIDEVTLVDTDGTPLERVPDVFDCWFESGSMPYAQQHFMGEQEEEFLAQYFPAQFIAEGLDQTRGWFYSLIVLGTALFGKSPFENVIVNGLVLAEDGKKMSKKLKNYPDPMELADRVGVDAMRYYLLSAPIMRGEDLNFSEKEVLELQRKNIGRLHNVLAMYELYADGTEASADSTHVLDQWIVSRLNELIAESTAGYKAYELDKATRPVADFIDDVSVWYLRRSRDRLKQNPSVGSASPRLESEDHLKNSEDDKRASIATLRYVLRELAKVMAPAMPFYAEHLYQAVKTSVEPESVHLTAWPTGGEVASALQVEMQQVRELVTKALEARTKVGIKVRQPLAALQIGMSLPPAMTDIIRDEVNVKVVTEGAPEGEVVLDTVLTPELVAEGVAREFMREVQEARKTAGLTPHQLVTLEIATGEAGQVLLQQFSDQITRTVGARVMTFVSTTTGIQLTIGEYSFTFTVHP
jgi:isoleucyl-tRNA synthetase